MAFMEDVVIVSAVRTPWIFKLTHYVCREYTNRKGV